MGDADLHLVSRTFGVYPSWWCDFSSGCWIQNLISNMFGRIAWVSVCENAIGPTMIH